MIQEATYDEAAHDHVGRIDDCWRQSHLSIADKIKSGDINAALGKASRRWSSLPQGKGQPGFYPKQPSVTYESFESNYKSFGGTVK